LTDQNHHVISLKNNRSLGILLNVYQPKLRQ